MSRKQEIYRDILRWALPQSRNTLSRFRRIGWWKLLSRKELLDLRAASEVSQFVHNLYVSILDEEFTFHDVWFLNFQARSFIEGNSDATCYSHSLFCFYVQQLFQIVPEEMREKLKWDGPQGDYNWARPRTGAELSE